jgi:hypothetical protein
MMMPLLATPAATSAICRGVAATSYWPIDAWASAGVFSNTVPGTSGSGRA